MMMSNKRRKATGQRKLREAFARRLERGATKMRAKQEREAIREALRATRASVDEISES
jgi:hypothetical protein